MAVILTFLFTTGLFGGLAWWACRRITHHLRENPEGVAALTTHLFVPLLGRKPEEGQEAGSDGLPGGPEEAQGVAGTARQESPMSALRDHISGERRPRGGAR